MEEEKIQIFAEFGRQTHKLKYKNEEDFMVILLINLNF
jgi:hypothetical protein